MKTHVDANEVMMASLGAQNSTISYLVLTLVVYYKLS
jgi:hypothetical protein